jgi:hypothetical protein
MIIVPRLCHDNCADNLRHWKLETLRGDRLSASTRALKVARPRPACSARQEMPSGSNESGIALLCLPTNCYGIQPHFIVVRGITCPMQTGLMSAARSGKSRKHMRPDQTPSQTVFDQAILNTC